MKRHLDHLRNETKKSRVKFAIICYDSQLKNSNSENETALQLQLETKLILYQLMYLLSIKLKNNEETLPYI